MERNRRVVSYLYNEYNTPKGVMRHKIAELKEDIMNADVEFKLMNLVAQFNNKTLKDYALREKEVDGKRYLLLELNFVDSGKNRSTMVLALDRESTTSDSADLYEELFNK